MSTEAPALPGQFTFTPPEPPAPTAADLLPHAQALRFHGTGSEYFRIWVVNLCLTLFSLGLYSPWAKVRKARWFARNTELAGQRFDFHGEPWRILLGRVLALLLLGLWTQVFDLSATAALGVLALFCALGPLLFVSAQRFRLANSSWCGLRFGFDAPKATAYAVCVPALLLWSASGVLAQMDIDQTWSVWAAGLSLLTLPWSHARLKRLQHVHARYGAQRFGFSAPNGLFYRVYVAALLPLLLATAVASVVVWGFPAGKAWPLLAGAGSVLLVWLVVWPTMAARLQHVVWSHTRLGPVAFRGQLEAGRLRRLVIGHTLLVLLTAGLWWPMAAVAVARYRIESLVVRSPIPLAELQVAARPQAAGAAGEGTVDLFGLDIGL